MRSEGKARSIVVLSVVPLTAAPPVEVALERSDEAEAEAEEIAPPIVVPEELAELAELVK
jgi:hypothetical protein